MFCKLYASLYQGTLRGRADEILVFTNLVAHCDEHGYVDKHWRAIAEEVGLSENRVKAAILILESPDPESRSPERGGARIYRADEHRAWGWYVTNYKHYRNIRTDDARREQNRLAQERFRAKKKGVAIPDSKPDVSNVSNVSNVSKLNGKSAHADADADADALPPPPKGWPGKVEEAIAYGKSIGVDLAEQDCIDFWDYYEARGWKTNGENVTDWKALLRSWKNKKRNIDGQRNNTGRGGNPASTTSGGSGKGTNQSERSALKSAAIAAEGIRIPVIGPPPGPIAQPA